MTGRLQSGRSLLRAREQFLVSDGHDAVGIREEIRASWLRSRQQDIDVERLAPPYVERVEGAETPLVECAEPVLRQVAEDLADQPVALILTDAQGVVLKRSLRDSSLRRHMDSRQLAPGFTYAESSVGTNGIGTALETRRPTIVNGAEHFVGDLVSFSCAGVPIFHPVTSSMLGVLDLTSFALDSDQLLLGLARTTARRIEEQLLSRASLREIALVREYLAACKHHGGSVVALNDELTIMNTSTQQTFDTADQSALLARMRDMAGATEATTLLADLPSGQVVRLDYRPTRADSGQLAGGVVRLRAHESSARATGNGRPATVRLPGVAGSSPHWLRVCRSVLESARRNEWVVVEGEDGVGKLTVLRGAHRQLRPGGHFRVLECAEAGDGGAWLDEVEEELNNRAQGTVVLRRVHLLPEGMIRELAALLQEHEGTDAVDRPWVAMTTSESRDPLIDAALFPAFPHTVKVPALRHHVDDLPQLVSTLLERISRADRLTLAPLALSQLSRMPWSGNVEQLRRILTGAAAHRRAGVIGLEDLPPECRSVSRRKLSVMESLERDAIVEALDAHGGNKDLAAESLGMSRATIYRKIKGYGITQRPATPVA